MRLNGMPLPVTGHKVDKVIKALRPHLNLEKGPWIAGGCPRRLIANDLLTDFDVDVFYNTRITPALAKTVNGLDDHDGIFGPISPRVQLTKRPFVNKEKLLEDFDFTVCQFVTDGTTVMYPEQAMLDLTNRLLRLNDQAKIKEPTRIMRYASYDFEVLPCVLESLKNYSFASLHYYKGIPYSESFGQHIEEMKRHDLRELITLSLIGDICFERFDEAVIAFIGGAPFPAPLALVFMYCQNMRMEITEHLCEFWNFLGVDRLMMWNRINRLTFDQFIGSYRAFARDDQLSSRVISTTLP